MAEMVMLGRKGSTPWKIGLGILFLLAAAGNSTRPATGGLAGATGALVGLSITLFGGVALIASGLPKNLGNEEFRKARRRLWYKLMGVGFLVMALSAFALESRGFFGAGVLVIFLYSFVWSWFSWKFADNKTVEKVRVRAGRTVLSPP